MLNRPTAFATKPTFQAIFQVSGVGWKPWEKSTGQKSYDGKAAVARNAFTGGLLVNLRAIKKTMNEALSKQRPEWHKRVFASVITKPTIN